MTTDPWDDAFNRANDEWARSQDTEWSEEKQDTDPWEASPETDTWGEWGYGKDDGEGYQEARDLGMTSARDEQYPPPGEYTYIVYYDDDQMRTGHIFYTSGDWSISQVILAANGDIDSDDVMDVFFDGE